MLKHWTESNNLHTQMRVASEETGQFWCLIEEQFMAASHRRGGQANEAQISGV